MPGAHVRLSASLIGFADMFSDALVQADTEVSLKLPHPRSIGKLVDQIFVVSK
jgi:hypothetical protein